MRRARIQLSGATGNICQTWVRAQQKGAESGAQPQHGASFPTRPFLYSSACWPKNLQNSASAFDETREFLPASPGPSLAGSSVTPAQPWGGDKCLLGSEGSGFSGTTPGSGEGITLV